MNIAILGFGSQGQSAYEYWSSDGHSMTICDQNEQLVVPNGAESQLGEDYLNGLDNFDLIVRSPSIHPREIASANTPGTLEKVTSVTDEFLRVCPTSKVIGVTGTKGKGTTSSLIAKILEAAGEKVHLGGNIGIPPLELLKSGITENDWVGLELANFQTIDLHYSPMVAVCLMVVPEHLNWHTDFEEYVHAKAQLFANQTADNVAIFYAPNSTSRFITSKSPGQKIPYYEAPGAHVENDIIVINGQAICHTQEIKLLGAHNWQNVCAAITAIWGITQNVEAIRSVLTTFGGLEHRLELVRELHKIRYYDDSFGTTPETAIVAIEAFHQPKVIILGGSDKGASYDGLANVVAGSNVRCAVLIGDTAEAIKIDLLAEGFTNIVMGGDNMKDIVKAAKHHAKHGDVVLLSTGCASFGMFKNYKDRAEQFIAAVKALS